ncbi:MAG: M20 family metallopeptidase [Acholeplasmataceae bacterium]|nr:M20 family metallopeptidase [Acholeplasmataceae bacterium]
MEKTILEQIKNEEEEMLKFAEKIVNIDSGYDCPEGVAEVAHHVGDFLAKLDFKIEYLETPNEPVQILATRPCPGKKKVMLMGHMDTVFPKGTVAERPFRIENGIAYGPGVMDMKSGIAIGLYTLKALIDNKWNDTDLTVFFVGDEEINHPKTNAVENFKKYGKGMDAVFNMEPGRAEGEVVTGRKGLWRPKIKVEGVAAHSGNEPEKGASAIIELAHKAIDITALTNFATGTTYNVGVFNGGRLANIIPDEALAKLDVRFKTIEEADKAKENVKEILAKTYIQRTTTTLIDEGIVDYMPPFEETPAGLKLYEFLRKQAEKLGQTPLGRLYVGGSSDAGYTTMVGAPTICSMGPKSVGAHSNNEYAYVESYVPRAQLLAMAIMHLDEM